MATHLKKEKSAELGFQHIILAVVLFVALFWIIQREIVPRVAASFVVSLFAPTAEDLSKTGFVNFSGDGLVWGSCPKEKEGELKAQSDLKVKKANINREYIFDFTFESRTEAVDGYSKDAGKFYAKAPNLGEKPIYLDPNMSFIILAVVFAIVLMLLVTMVLPTSIGFMAVLFDRQIDNTKAKIRLQTGFNDEIVEVLILPDNKLAELSNDEVEQIYRIIWNRTVPDEMASAKQMLRFDDVFDENTDIVMFRTESLYARIKEYFSDFVLKEIEDTRDGLKWRKNHFLIMAGLRLYMAHHFTEKYANNVTGLAYGGAAILIIAIGIRGLKFIPAQQPSLILLAIFLEFSMLSLLAVTLIYTEEEERMDKMLKKMEDASKGQLEVLRGQQHDIHQLSNALVGQTAEIIKNRVERAIEEYMTSGNNIEQEIAQQIAHKVLVSMRESSENSSSSTLKRR
jgi:hypothetical protein